MPKKYFLNKNIHKDIFSWHFPRILPAVPGHYISETKTF